MGYQNMWYQVNSEIKWRTEYMEASRSENKFDFEDLRVDQEIGDMREGREDKCWKHQCVSTDVSLRTCYVPGPGQRLKRRQRDRHGPVEKQP